MCSISFVVKLFAVQKTPKRSSGRFLRRRKRQNDRRGTFYDAENTKMIVGEVSTTQKTPKQSSGNFLRRRKRQNGRRGGFGNSENTKNSRRCFFNSH